MLDRNALIYCYFILIIDILLIKSAKCLTVFFILLVICASATVLGKFSMIMNVTEVDISNNYCYIIGQ